MNIAIIGATGLVGREILKILFQKKLIKKNNIYLYASKASENKKIKVGRFEFFVQELCENNLIDKYDFALFSAGKDVSKRWANVFVKKGAIVIDNSSAYRRDKSIPLVVPEINGKEAENKKIIANPNCSTIGASLPIHAIKKHYKIKEIIISTFQAVSGAGKKGIDDLIHNTKNKFNYNIKNNLIPQIDVLLPNGYTFEEDKIDFELKKILKDKKLKISATCVRVPIKNCHSESIYLELDKTPNLNIIKHAMKEVGGMTVLEGMKNKLPMPCLANNCNDVFVGRLRYDTANANAISFFISFDNIRKGAALNAVQIMEFLISRETKFKKALQN